MLLQDQNIPNVKVIEIDQLLDEADQSLFIQALKQRTNEHRVPQATPAHACCYSPHTPAATHHTLAHPMHEHTSACCLPAACHHAYLQLATMLTCSLPPCLPAACHHAYLQLATMLTCSLPPCLSAACHHACLQLATMPG